MQIQTTTASISGSTISTTPSHALLAWSDFQIVLTVHRHASVAKACADLGITHSTLLRKLDAIESRLKAKLFERVRGCYSLTQAGHEITEAAVAFEPLALASETRVRGQDLRPSGDVRVAVASIVLEQLLPGVLVQFASAFPEVRIEFISSREQVSLSRREADVAIRIADQVPDWLVGRKLGQIEFKIYGLCKDRTKLPLRDVRELAEERRWIGFERDSREFKSDRWLATNVSESRQILRVDNFSHALTMVRAGLGIALLPSFVEHQLPELHALTTPIKEMRTPLWLITHPELKNTMRIKVMLRAFGPALAHLLQTTKSEAEPSPEAG